MVTLMALSKVISRVFSVPLDSASSFLWRCIMSALACFLFAPFLATSSLYWNVGRGSAGLALSASFTVVLLGPRWLLAERRLSVHAVETKGMKTWMNTGWSVL